MEVKGKEYWLISSPKKFASGSQGHLHDKSPVSLDIHHIYQQQPVLSLEPLAKPLTVFLSCSFCSLCLFSTAAFSCIFSPTNCLLCQLFFSSSAKTSHSQVSKWNVVR